MNTTRNLLDELHLRLSDLSATQRRSALDALTGWLLTSIEHSESPSLIDNARKGIEFSIRAATGALYS